MTFKFPSASIGAGAAINLLQGASAGTIASNAFNATGNAVAQGVNAYGNNAINKGLGKVGDKLGLKLGGMSLDKLLTDPTGALIGALAGGSGPGGTLYQKLAARPDPLMEIDWSVEMPLGLPGEYVEEIQWSHPRFNAAQGIFRNGTHVFMVEGMESAPITVTLYEDRILTATNWLYSWKNLIYNPTTRLYSYPAQYKRNIRADYLDMTGQVIGKVLFMGCFPSTFPQVNFASEGSTRARLQVELSCDHIVFEPTSTDGSSAIGNLANGLLGQLKGGANSLTTLANSAIASGGAGLRSMIPGLFA